jgi:hypothetical protein
LHAKRYAGLKSWLDENLPRLVEQMVQGEIERIARAGTKSLPLLSRYDCYFIRTERTFHVVKTIKEIARDLRISRNTIRKVLRSGETSFEYERTVQPRRNCFVSCDAQGHDQLPGLDGRERAHA